MWKPILALTFVVPCFGQAQLVKGAGNFIHAVGDLDQSVHFYRDLIGMEAPRPPGDWQTTGAPAPAGDKNIVGLRFGYTVSSDAVLSGPFKALGLAGSPRASDCRTVEDIILNDNMRTIVKLPDGFEITLVHAQPGKKSA